MRTKQTFAAAIVCCLALNFNAFAKVVYDRELTNEWFKVVAADADLDRDSKWSKPKNGSARVVGSEIKLDTDVDDELAYTPAKQSDDVAIVSARFMAVANSGAPALPGSPQASITVVANNGETNWYGLVGGSADPEWVKFATPTPRVGEFHDVEIEFDLRQDKSKQIRYSVDGVVLGNGWYENPAPCEAITSVAFAGAGDIGDFAGDNIAKYPVVTITETAQVEGFDYTNGTLKVTMTDVVADATATLKIVDFVTGEVKEFTGLPISAGSGTALEWQIAELAEAGALVPGSTYGYELTIVPSDSSAESASVTKVGTFVAASTTPENWFSADATSGESVVEGGSWDETPAIAENVYVFKENEASKKFSVDVENLGKGSNHLARIDVNLVFETYTRILPQSAGSLGGFLVADSETTGPVWKAYTASGWVDLTGAVVPEAGKPYVIRAEISFLEAKKQVRYLVSTDAGANFSALAHDGSQWLDLPDSTKASLEAVEMGGTGSVANFVANIADKALVEFGDVKYDTVVEAMAAADKSDERIKLLTNVTITPTKSGTYWITENDKRFNVILPDSRNWSYTYNATTGELTFIVRCGATYLIW